MPLRAALAAALVLLAACGSSGDEKSAAGADSATVVTPTGSPNVIGTADDRARRMADSSNAAVQARDAQVEALSKEASGGGN